MSMHICGVFNQSPLDSEENRVIKCEFKLLLMTFFAGWQLRNLPIPKPRFPCLYNEHTALLFLIPVLAL